MSDLRDVELDKWQSSFEPERSRAGRRVALVIVILLALAAGAYFAFWRRAQPAPTDVRVHTDQAVAAKTPDKPVAEPGEAIDLPPLEQTDPIVRQLVSSLSSHPKVAAWLTTDQLVRNFTVVVFNVANGRTPSRHLGRLRPTQGFQAIEKGTTITIDPRSYQRYDAYADAVAAVDARGVARLYATLKPRIQDGYRELGYPEGDFDAVLERAFAELLKTPVIESPVMLRSKSVAYEFADPRLQSLSSAQRQFLRMGPRNVRIIQAKLRELAPLLGLAPEPQL
jgi:Protein of unknown function (DUF3014)